MIINKETILSQIEKLIMVKKENRYTFGEKIIFVLTCIMIAIICFDYPIFAIPIIFFLYHSQTRYSYNYEDILVIIKNIKESNYDRDLIIELKNELEEVNYLDEYSFDVESYLEKLLY